MINRIVRYADGWLPIALSQGEDQLAEQITTLREKTQMAGKERPDVTVFSAPKDPGSITKMEEIGVDRLVWGLTPAPADVVLPEIQAYGKVLAAYNSGNGE